VSPSTITSIVSQLLTTIGRRFGLSMGNFPQP
jgi:hypothetical protein